MTVLFITACDSCLGQATAHAILSSPEIKARYSEIRAGYGEFTLFAAGRTVYPAAWASANPAAANTAKQLEELQSLGAVLVPYNPAVEREAAAAFNGADIVLLTPPSDVGGSSCSDELALDGEKARREVLTMARLAQDIVTAAAKTPSVKRLITFSVLHKTNLLAATSTGSMYEAMVEYPVIAAYSALEAHVAKIFAGANKAAVIARSAVNIELLFMWSGDIAQSSKLSLPLGTSSARFAPVAFRDYVDALVALASPSSTAGNDGGVAALNFTGPDLVGPSELAAVLSTSLGREIAVDAAVSAESVSAGLRANPHCSVHVRYFANDTLKLIRSGEMNTASNDLEGVLGRKPQSLASVVSMYKAAFSPQTASD
ncbi:hypothetical protein GQ42DRAFT_165885 [Ramicandelaber brevisporus]|nr:hypothetical protein GQ42DRAFT_165885 [Ramicandelaber brevisporus]